MVTRLDAQKGLDITGHVAHLLLNAASGDAQMVVLGSGAAEYEDMFRHLAAYHREKMAAVLRYDAALAPLVYAGSDIFLMPSRFEPCGLGQMIAMRYGSVPVVRATGGLVDTVREGVSGFLFADYTVEAFWVRSAARWRRTARPARGRACSAAAWPRIFRGPRPRAATSRCLTGLRHACGVGDLHRRSGDHLLQETGNQGTKRSLCCFRCARAVSNLQGMQMANRSGIGVSLALLSVLVCLAALVPAAHAQDRSHDLSWGPVADGLRMSIALTPSSATATTARFRVAIENAGERDAVLNMGLMMANGQVLLPTALFLTITDSQKVGRELSFFSDRGSGRLSGKMDDYVVPLRPGATYTMASPKPLLGRGDEAVSSKALDGEHTVVARLVARGAQVIEGRHCFAEVLDGDRSVERTDVSSAVKNAGDVCAAARRTGHDQVGPR